MNQLASKHMRNVVVSLALAISVTACSSEPAPLQKEALPVTSVTAPEPAAPKAAEEPQPGAVIEEPVAAVEIKPEPPPDKVEVIPAPSAPPESSSGSRNPAAAVAGTAKPAAPKPDATTADRTPFSWYYMKKPKGQVPNFPGETKKYTDGMKALWVGTGKKVYLTIDTGGALGDMDTIVSSLKNNDAKANFFIAGYNVKKNPDYVRRLVADGHLVANHTMTHTDMTLQTDDQIRKEIEDFEKLMKEVTGQEASPFFRFPYGRYNMHILQLVSDMGYTSVFWSTAMRDWEPRKNGAEDPYNDIMNNLHDGNIILMHQGSPENIQALDRIVKEVKQAGYEFALLSDIVPPPVNR
jgi:peptidoglycan-N-acetylmuramic acid deacetylase